MSRYLSAMSSPPAALYSMTHGRLIALAMPCGTSKCAPQGCDSEWAIPIAAAEVGWIARLAAMSMLPRASSSSGWATARSRLSRIIRRACSA